MCAVTEAPKMHHDQPNTKTLEYVAALARTQFWEDIFGVHDFCMMDVVFRDVRCPYFMHTFVRKTLVIVVSGLRGLSANEEENEYEAWKKSIANMDKKQKKRAVKKMFEKLQNEHKTLTTAKARGKLAVAEIKGCNWLHKKVTELKLNPRQVKTSTI
jgi:hypothetical protein